MCVYNGTYAVHWALCFSLYALKGIFTQRVHSEISVLQKARFIYSYLFLTNFKNSWMTLPPLPRAPLVLFSGLCWKWCDTNFPAEGGVKRERWEHIINLATHCIPASCADPRQHTRAGFSLVPPRAAWQSHTCSPAAPPVPGWPRCFHWKRGGSTV